MYGIIFAISRNTTNSKKQIQMSDNGKISLAIALLVISLGLIYFVSKKVPAPKNINQTAAVLGRTTAAEPGQIISGFPKDLIMASSFKTEQSYNIDYGSLNQYTVNFSSSSGVGTEYANYLNYFKQHAYSIINKQLSSRGTSAAIYASNATSDIGVQISAAAPGTSVIINYLKK